MNAVPAAPVRENPAALDEAAIRELVAAFYADVRRDPRLGPLFERVIGADWAPHLERMVAFWSTVALHTKSFRGNVLQRHLAIAGLREEFFGHWLTLWQRHTDARLQPDDAANLQQIARGIARNLFLGVFGRVPVFSVARDADGTLRWASA